jgi:hypothetical protein
MERACCPYIKKNKAAMPLLVYPTTNPKIDHRDALTRSRSGDSDRPTASLTLHDAMADASNAQPHVARCLRRPMPRACAWRAHAAGPRRRPALRARVSSPTKRLAGPWPDAHGLRRLGMQPGLARRLPHSAVQCSAAAAILACDFTYVILSRLWFYLPLAR